MISWLFPASPGAVDWESILRLSTWPRQRTVAATHQGRPSREQTPVMIPTTSMSRWYPQPFYKPGLYFSGYPLFQTYLEFVLFPVDNNRGNLLVHEQQNGEEKGRDWGKKVNPPWRFVIKHWYPPVSHVRPGWLQQTFYIVIFHGEHFYLEDCWHG